MSRHPAAEAIARWDGEALTVLGPQGQTSGLDAGSLRGKSVVVVLSRRAAQVRATELPPASPEDLRQLVRLRLADLFPAGPGEIAFSVAPRTQSELPGATPIYGARISDLTEIHGAAKTGGFRVTAILPEAAGSALLARELGLADALVASPDAPGLGLDVIRSGETTLSRPSAPGSPVESEVRRTFLAANSGSLPIVAAAGAAIPFADRSTERSPVSALLDAPERWEGLDLVPDDVRTRRIADVRRARLRQGALVCVSSLLLFAFVVKTRSDKAAEIEKQQSRLNAQVNRFKKGLEIESAQNLKLDPQAKLLGRAFTPAQRASDVIYLVTSQLPKDAWITALTFDRGKVLQIRGTAMASDGVSTFLRNLGTLNRFRDVKLSFANVGEIETKPVVNFAITAFPIGNVPLEEAKKGRSVTAATTATTPAR